MLDLTKDQHIKNLDMQVLYGETDHQDHSCKKLEWMKSKKHLYVWRQAQSITTDVLRISFTNSGQITMSLLTNYTNYTQTKALILILQHR